MRKMNVLAALMLCPSLILLFRTTAMAADEPSTTQPAATQPSVAELSRQRIASAERTMKLAEQMHRFGTGTSEESALWMQRWLQARLEAAGDEAERLAILREYVGLAKSRERDAEGRMQAGVSSAVDAEGARYFRIDAELRLAKRLARAEDKGKDEGGRGENGGKSDKQALQGNWKVVKKVKNAEPEDVGEPVYLKFVGQAVAMSKGNEKSEGTFAVDDSRTPKRMTLTGTSGEKAGSVFEAVYELQGNTLKIAYGTGDNAKTPPNDFSGGEGTGLLVLERQKE